MAKPARRAPTTVYLDPKIAKAVKVKAALCDRSVSDLVNESLAHSLVRDSDDLALIRKRKAEKSRPYEEFLAELRRDGLI